MKVLILAVTYNSYPTLRTYLDSIDTALSKTKDDVCVDVYVADNSTNKEKFEYHSDRFNVKIYELDNLGYFGGADKVAAYIPKEQFESYDYVAISNVDILFKEDFFEQLYNLKVDENVGWIAPRIFNSTFKYECNPMRVNRYTKKELYTLYYLYKYPIMLNIYENTIKLLKNKVKKRNSQRTEKINNIYCGSGPFFLFTNKGAKNFFPINFPLFLYGEEIFTAETLLNKGLNIVYEASIELTVEDAHVSTKKLGSKKLNDLRAKSIQKLLDLFFI